MAFLKFDFGENKMAENEKSESSLENNNSIEIVEAFDVEIEEEIPPNLSDNYRVIIHRTNEKNSPSKE